MIDPTTLLAELAAIQRDVRTIHEAVDLHHARVTPEATRHVVDRIASLMSSIAAQTPAVPVPIASSGTYAAADNGMLGTVNQRLNAIERRLNEHDIAIAKAQRKADGHG